MSGLLARPKLSVIIPVFNAEIYLRECLDSVVCQTLRDIEIICINDASDDASPDILAEYGRRDGRIKIINFPENRGVSVARNAGMDAAAGEYLGFIDSDDTVDPDFYEKLIATATSNQSQMALGNIKYLRNQNSGEVTRNALLTAVSEDKFCHTFCWWASVYESGLIKNNKIRFLENLRFGQDIVFLTQCVTFTNACPVVFDTFYHYRTNSATSLYSVALSQDKIESQIAARMEILKFMNQHLQIIGEKPYLHRMLPYFLNFFGLIFLKNTKKSVRLMVLKKSVEFFKQVKYREPFVSEIKRQDIKLYMFLESEDIENLYMYVRKILLLKDKYERERYELTVHKFKFLNFVTLASKTTSAAGTTIKILGIPLFHVINEKRVPFTDTDTKTVFVDTLWD
ncbi:MAG: glycosyltransferase [Rickettsiales bacterium]|jgi:glycosyltransferase involved in cell wall biosynthesis|nr:glycosyltransferase [Rickettsiales bacterium]